MSLNAAFDMFPPVGNELIFQLAAELPYELLHSLGFMYSPVIPNNLVAPDGMVFWPSRLSSKSLPLKGLRREGFACLFSRQVQGSLGQACYA